MTSQQLGNLALEEHRAVMAAHYRDCINRPTEGQYEALLDQLRTECMACPEITSPPSSSPSLVHF